LKKEKLWWEEELELQALLVRHPDDPADTADQHFLEVRSFKKVQLMDDTRRLVVSPRQRQLHQPG
jgi:hypothetical protein